MPQQTEATKPLKFLLWSRHPYEKNCEAKGHKEAKMQGRNTGLCWECNGGPMNYTIGEDA